MMITGVPPPALPDLRLALQLARPARQLTGARERGIAGVAARGRGAAPHQAPAEPGLGRPGSAGRADPAPATSAAGAPAGHARHRPALAPPPGHKEADLPEPHGTAAGQRRDRRAHRAPRHPEPQLGIPADPGRAAQARPPGRRLHDPPDPQGPADSPGAEPPHRHDVAPVPARPAATMPATWFFHVD